MGSADSSPPRRMRFYRRLTREQKREYDRSDTATRLTLAPDPQLARGADRLVSALEEGDRRAVSRAAQALADGLWVALARGRAGPVPQLKVLRTRPRRAGSEFHGLYTRFADGRAEIRVWMLTAAHGQVVRPRTFLRTLLHEICHHVDITLLGLPSSFHTLGFHARESSLLRALERGGARVPGGRSRIAPKDGSGPRARPAEAPRQTQLDLFNPARFASGRRPTRGG